MKYVLKSATIFFAKMFEMNGGIWRFLLIFKRTTTIVKQYFDY